MSVLDALDVDIDHVTQVSIISSTMNGFKLVHIDPTITLSFTEVCGFAESVMLTLTEQVRWYRSSRTWSNKFQGNRDSTHAAATC